NPTRMIQAPKGRHARLGVGPSGFCIDARMSRQIFLFVTISAIVASTLSAAEPLRVIYDGQKHPMAIEAVGWSKEDIARFAKIDVDTLEYLHQRVGIHVLDDKGELLYPALSGSYETINGGVRFTPQFPLRPGMTYQAFFVPIARPSPEPGGGPIDFPRRSLEIAVP